MAWLCLYPWLCGIQDWSISLLLLKLWPLQHWRQTTDNLSSLGSMAPRVCNCVCFTPAEELPAAQREWVTLDIFCLSSRSLSMTACLSQVPIASTAGPGASSSALCPAMQV